MRGGGRAIGKTRGMDDGWDPIAVRVDADDDERRSNEHPAGPRRKKVRHLALAEEPIIGPGLEPDEEVDVTLPRLARHQITLDDGHTVGVAVCGRGVPLVVVHGFSAEGILYAQTLSRLVDLGFKVIAVDVAGHGGTLGLPTGAQSLSSYADLLARVLDHLGVKRMVLAGHSMGGRLVTELAAAQPDRVIGLILLDAIVGDTWDRMVYLYRFFPPLMLGTGGTLVVDTITTVPWFADPRQAMKLGRLVAPTIRGHLRQPWRMLAPAASILRSRGSRRMLESLRERQGPRVRRPRRLGSGGAVADGEGRRPAGPRRPRRRGEGEPLLAPQGPRDDAGDHARPHAGPSRHRGAEGAARCRRRPGRRHRRRGGGRALRARRPRAGAHPRQRHHDTEDLHRPPRYRWKVLPARSRGD